MAAAGVSLEQYKEIIVNGLDLVSFALVTPQVVRKLRPSFSNVLPIVLIGLYMGAAGYIWFSNDFIWTLGERQYFWRFPPEEQRAYFFDLLKMYGILIPLVIGGGLLGVLFLEVLPAWLNRNAVLLGIVLFVLSRLVAFSVVAHGVLSSH